MDILIYAKPEIIEHKMVDKVPKDNVCYWGQKTPSENNLSVIRKVYFSNGKKIYAEGRFFNHILKRACDKRELTGVWFAPLKRVNKKQPKKPPTRGWCYINR